jgi:hypothetical protein
MQLRKLTWRDFNEKLAYASFKRPNCRGTIVIWRLLNENTYTIVERRIEPCREWLNVDELTAECILIELTKSPHDAEDNPER